MISATIFLIVLATAYFASFFISINKIKTQTKAVLDKGYYQDASLIEANYMLVYVKGSTYFVKRSSQVNAAEQKGIIQQMFASSGNTFDYDGRIFYYDKAEQSNGEVLYAIDDITAEISTFRFLIGIFALADVLCAILVGFLAWLTSKYVFDPLKKALDKQSELIANASHELKTPLSVISAQTSLIKDEIQDNPNAEKWLEGMEYQTNRMETLIKEMLELSKLEAHNDIQTSEVNVSDLVENVILTMEASCFEKQVTLDYDITPSIVALSDKDKLEKLITILMDNAVKYTQSDGSITVSLTRKKNNFTFTVQNSGEGIPKEKLSKIFDRFYRQDESRSQKGDSFGLGLAIAKSLVDAMQGSITCESEVDKYTRFIVVLPL